MKSHSSVLSTALFAIALLAGGVAHLPAQSALDGFDADANGTARGALSEAAAPQLAILSTTLSSNQIVIVPDANLPGTQRLVPGLPVGAQPHGVAYFGSDHALVADGDNSRIFVVQISTGTLVSTIDTAAATSFCKAAGCPINCTPCGPQLI